MSFAPTYIKVSHQSVTRRVKFQDWQSFEQQLYALFEIPTTQRFHLVYKDADDDVISLSTEAELRELIATTQGTVRLNLQLGNGVEDWVMEDAQTVASTPVPAPEPEPEAEVAPSVNSRKPYVIDVPDEDARPPSSSSDKGKAPEHINAEAGPSTTSPPASQQEDQSKSQDQDDTPPFVKVAQEFSALLDSFQDVVEKNPQLTERFNAVFDQILKAVPIDLGSIAEQLGNLREQQNGEKSEHQNQNPFANHPFAPFLGAFGGGFGPFAQTNPCAGGFQRGPGRCYPGRRYQGCPRPLQQQQHEPLTQEQIDEKLKTLHTMGFWQDDELNKDLLNRYGGNIERVVEVSLRQ